MSRNVRTDAGKYDREGIIQKPVNRVENGQGGNSAAGQWETVREPMIWHKQGSMHRPYEFAQLYPTATSKCGMRTDPGPDAVVIAATLSILINGRRYQILGAVDTGMEEIETVLALVEWQAKGTQKS